MNTILQEEHQINNDKYLENKERYFAFKNKSNLHSIG